MSMQRYSFLSLVMAALAVTLSLQSAHAQTANRPTLLIETGRHSAPITAISATKDGLLFVTCSDDKTIRIWNSAGRQMHVIRPPVGSRINDSITSVAISPDGNQVVFQFSILEKLEEKGNLVTLFPIQVLNLKTQKITSIRRAFEPVRLSFSPDGRYLGWISAFSSDTGFDIAVHRTSDWALYARANRKTANGAAVPGTLDFSPDGNRIVTNFGDQTQVFAIKGADYAKRDLADVSSCKAAEIYCPTIVKMAASEKRMVIEKALKSEHGKQPIGAKWSPDGKWLAYGYLFSPSVTLVSTVNWGQAELLATGLELAYINGNKTMAHLTWSLDSKILLSTGTMGPEVFKPTVIRKWRVGAKPIFEDEIASPGKNRKLDISGMVATNSGYAFAADDTLGFYEDGGIRVLEPSSGLRDNLSVYNNADGLIFYFFYPARGQTIGDMYGFNAIKREVNPAPRELPAAFRPIEAVPGMNQFGMRSNRPELNGVRLEVDSVPTASAFTADGQTLLVATSHTLCRFDRNGVKLWCVPIPARATALNASRDGRLVLLILADGTLRWHRLLDGRELVAFYALNDRKSWAMWTPDGYFDTSAGAELLFLSGVRHDNGLLDIQSLPLSSPMYRPDKIDDALTKMQIIGEATPIPAKP